MSDDRQSQTQNGIGELQRTNVLQFKRSPPASEFHRTTAVAECPCFDAIRPPTTITTSAAAEIVAAIGLLINENELF